MAILSGLAAVFAERGVAGARRANVRGRVIDEEDAWSRRVPSIGSRSLIVNAVVAVAGFLVHGPVGALAAIVVAIGVRRISERTSRRASGDRLQEQLADAVTAIASAVRSGMSVPQAISYAADEADPPAREHLLRVVHDLEVGVPVADAVSAWAEREQSEDARLVSGALNLHRRSGGDLPVVLDHVATAVRERLAVAREVRALTAQARLSGMILGLLPIGFFAFLWVTSRRDIEGALGTPLGLGSILVGLLLEGGAFLWIRRLLEVA